MSFDRFCTNEPGKLGRSPACRGVQADIAQAVGLKSRYHGNRSAGIGTWGRFLDVGVVCPGDTDRQTGDDHVDRGVILVMVDYHPKTDPIPAVALSIAKESQVSYVSSKKIFNIKKSFCFDYHQLFMTVNLT